MVKTIKKAVLKYAEIQNHSFCNAGCLMCPYSCTSKMFPMGKMKNKLFQKIVAQLAKDFPTLRNISIMLQNEPLLDKNIYEKILFTAKKRDQFKRKFTISTTTNGVCLTKKLLLLLEKSGLDILNISLTPTNNKNKNLSPGINFSKIVEKIKKLPKLKKLKVCLRMVITNQNFDDIIFFVNSKTIKKLQAKNNLKIELSALTNRAGTLKNYSNLNLKFSNLVSPINLKNKVCFEPFHKISILFNGDVLICCHDWKRENILGNVKNQTIKIIWNNSKFKLVRKLLLNNNYLMLIPCKKCSIAKYFLSNKKIK
ncbi:hypothetical protein COT75_01295 [Candidatus Beckwithbacteria bacterium CG10_big_fil_rev_8_21_14_0_10_34_10]|uniref:Radical SAM core domain-containing protein n=1 Tax=Candidatus Beckwithbacteria bacterium CG10_big_fil_rev_8_21_14_0_10_34_10 TaxID=1974495 RepID=A0A2H0W9Z2_9BACT|nr:MAG: hypothetical protein COT75_01295 [Candidatus Beckwithbacteria bacterium CG10_big_fil_rev_8_21_14_0_10_34_10]